MPSRRISGDGPGQINIDNISKLRIIAVAAEGRGADQQRNAKHIACAAEALFADHVGIHRTFAFKTAGGQGRPAFADIGEVAIYRGNVRNGIQRGQRFLQCIRRA